MSQILVVDDEPAIREFVQSFLEDEGYSVSTGRDGAEALRRIEAQRPDLVLMDMMMPGLDGREVVRRLHEHPVHSAIPVILMSAASQWDRAVDGPIQFLRKPFDLDRLQEMIRATLRQRSDPGRARVAPVTDRRAAQDQSTSGTSFMSDQFAFPDLG
ncbi:MAG: hypothetical protein AVDCRST_MAG33-1868 [uncultured Thermomicrobiales bacterium]|uniref:Response regulatory domain-containing protein n=1 Tax=uncultured Thermomicrobiales bacterium TaxID=1645740 RepID=A0A6J4UZ59_9BACT|nr:MAG: hypothetical protein AVDCRST_MAG33-1868 [uncultured Thermomicrobiales bacterium]